MATLNRVAKPALKTIHTWTGIASGLFLSVVALTGSLITFRSEFERATLPQNIVAGSAQQRVTLNEVALQIVKERPDSHIRRVRIPHAPSDPYIFQVESDDKPTERIVSDSTSGQLLGTLQPGWIDWMIDLHRNFLSGRTGRKIVGVTGIVLFLLSATGLLMWLSGARNWRSWVSVRRRGSPLRFHYELHRASGLWAYAFLAVVSFTGIERAYPDTMRSVVRFVTGTPVTVPAPKGIDANSSLPLDEYLRIGRLAMQDGIPVELRLPAPGKGLVDLRLYRAGDIAPSGNHVYINLASGAVVQVDRIVDRPFGARFIAALAPIHYGQFGGIPIKIAWFLLGLSPTLLFVTGLIYWWRPAKRKSTASVIDEEALRVSQ
jgi:uncharacterized iron-regulated membrane protein